MCLVENCRKAARKNLIVLRLMPRGETGSNKITEGLFNVLMKLESCH